MNKFCPELARYRKNFPLLNIETVLYMKRSIAMDYKELKEQWLLEEKAVFQGWDFSHLNDRWNNGEITWDYAKIISSYLNSCDILLDMGTGGGEFLLTLNHPYQQTYITESYPPNIELCLKRLAPLGIGVKQVFDDSYLPFEDETFNVIINRHESFDIKEVSRILKPNGIFITQQVGGENSINLRKSLVPDFANQFPNHTLRNNVEIVKKQGFEILTQEEEFPKTCFHDIGAVVYFAKVIAWEFPGFSVESCFSQLCKLQERLEEKGFIENVEHRFIIVARKSFGFNMPAKRIYN